MIEYLGSSFDESLDESLDKIPLFCGNLNELNSTRDVSSDNQYKIARRGDYFLGKYTIFIQSEQYSRSFLTLVTRLHECVRRDIVSNGHDGLIHRITSCLEYKDDAITFLVEGTPVTKINGGASEFQHEAIRV